MSAFPNASGQNFSSCHVKLRHFYLLAMWDDFDIRDLNSNQQSSAKTSNDSDLDFWKNFDFPYLGDDGLTQDIACSALKFPIDINGLVAPSSSVQSLPDSSTVPATWMPQHQESQATLIDSAYVSQFMSSLNAHKMQSLPLLETNIQSKPNTQDDATTRKRKETSTEKLDPTEKRRRNTEASQRFRAKKKAQNEGNC